MYQLAERAGSGSFTLVVSSMEEQEQHLNDYRDPDGNHIAFAEPLDAALAQ